MTTINVPPDVRDWLERESVYLGVSLDALVSDYLTEAVLAKKRAAARVVPLRPNDKEGRHG